MPTSKNVRTSLKKKITFSFVVLCAVFVFWGNCSYSQTENTINDGLVSDIRTLDKNNLKQEAINIEKALNQVLIPTPDLKEDGIFSAKTVEALKAFQTANNLTADGIAGYKTRLALRNAQIEKKNISVPENTTEKKIVIESLVSDARTLDKNNLKQEAINIEKALNQVLIPTPDLKEDGIFSAKTVEALKAFQTANNLTADGIAGYKTRLALRNAQINSNTTNIITTPIVTPIVTTTPTPSVIVNTTTSGGGGGGVSHGGGGSHVDRTLKAISAFDFTSLSSSGNISGTNISVTVPYATDVTNLSPSITHNGASISPGSGVAQDFTNPVNYTVAALDGSSQSYTVTVSVALNPAKNITAFNFASPSVTGVINGTNISLLVPFGTNMTLTPTITITGASVSPASGVAHSFVDGVSTNYIVTAADSTTKIYAVTVNVDVDPDIALVAADKAALVAGSIKDANPDLSNVTVHLTNPLPSTGANGSSITWASSDTGVVSNDGQTITRPANGLGNASVDLTATLTKGVVIDTKTFNLIVLEQPSSAKAISAFTIPSQVGSTTINETLHTVAITMLYSANLSSLVPTISITGVSISPVSGLAQDFTNPVTYTVTAADASTQSYDVTVTNAPASSVATITSSTYTVSAGGTATETITAVPFNTSKATFLAALAKGNIYQTWNSTGISNTVLSNDTLVVTAEDGLTTVTYTVTVDADPNIAKVAADKAALVDSMIKGANPDLSNVTVHLTNPLPSLGSVWSSDITWASSDTGVVSNNGQTITRPAYSAGNVSLTMTATITKGVVTDTKVFNLIVLESPGDLKDITSFTFASPNVTGVISGTNIAVSVVTGTDVTALVPTIVHTGASISPSSGVAQNFTSPVDYTVTALDSSTKVYTVTVVPTIAVGDSYQGGKVAYLLQNGESNGVYSYDPLVQHGFIFSLVDQSGWGNWGHNYPCNGMDISGADGTALGTGLQNTLDMAAVPSCSTDPNSAVTLIHNVNINGYTDWYLPSIDELHLMYLNQASMGLTFSDVYYISSSEFGTTNCWRQSKNYEAPVYFYKTTGGQFPAMIRAMRSF